MNTVYVVFCMDTEGPCDDPNNDMLLKTWRDIDKAMDKIFENKFRNKFPDSNGTNLKIGWFFLTWTGFETNPRNRDFGYHKVRDHYVEKWGNLINKYCDEMCWHYHHPAKSKIGNEWGLDWLDNSEYVTIISRQILDRSWFPVSFRAGGTIESNESSLWIDHWFPFDYSNRSPLKVEGLIDWSDAKDDWTLYKPDIYNFTKQGFCKRNIARTLDLMTNEYCIKESEIEKAFQKASFGEDVILSVFDHDYRDIAERVETYLGKISSISEKYPNVKFEYASPKEAIVKCRQIEEFPKSIIVEAAVYNNKLRIWTSSSIYQNVPWIAFENENNEVIQIIDNIIQDSTLSWQVDLNNLGNYNRIGIGVSTMSGLSDTFIINNKEIFDGFFKKKILPHPINPNNIHEHSTLYPKLCIDRATGNAPEMDSVNQLCNILEEKGLTGCSLLDVGCASGQIWKSTKKLNIDYYGIDAFQRSIQLGKLILGEQGLCKSRLRNISIFNINIEERFDVVVNLFDFRYAPQFDKLLEIMARVTDKYLIIRAPSFGKEPIKNYIPDILLEEDYQTIKSFFNIYSINEIEDFLAFEGFKVSWVKDNRQKNKFNSKPEVVGGIEFLYIFLVAERISRRPNREEILGDYWSHHANQWIKKGEGLPT